jgi:hypothetical protein
VARLDCFTGSWPSASEGLEVWLLGRIYAHLGVWGARIVAASPSRSSCTTFYTVVLNVVLWGYTFTLSPKYNRSSITARKCVAYQWRARYASLGKMRYENNPKLRCQSYFWAQNSTKSTQNPQSIERILHSPSVGPIGRSLGFLDSPQKTTMTRAQSSIKH